MEAKKTKRVFYKEIWFYVIIFIIFIIFLIAIFLYNNKSNSGVGKNGINKEEFEQIKLGMSQNDVIKIISPENLETINEEVEKNEENHIYKYVYKYYGEKSGYAIITYQADYNNGDIFVLPKVIKKEQFNLK